MQRTIRRKQPYEKIENFMEFATQKFYAADMTKLKYLRKVNLEAYGYAIKTDHLMTSQS